MKHVLEQREEKEYENISIIVYLLFFSKHAPDFEGVDQPLSLSDAEDGEKTSPSRLSDQFEGEWSRPLIEKREITDDWSQRNLFQFQRTRLNSKYKF